MSTTLKVVIGFVAGVVFVSMAMEDYATNCEKAGYWRHYDRFYKLEKLP